MDPWCERTMVSSDPQLLSSLPYVRLLNGPLLSKINELLDSWSVIGGLKAWLFVWFFCEFHGVFMYFLWVFLFISCGPYRFPFQRFYIILAGRRSSFAFYKARNWEGQLPPLTKIYLERFEVALKNRSVANDYFNYMIIILTTILITIVLVLVIKLLFSDSLPDSVVVHSTDPW